ncbi:MAG TPA: hypothetical protein VFP68_19015 [Burkholderiaceae bacterium]|nr:hypothetical protein [Burkholderiaceae bacterium]
MAIGLTLAGVFTPLLAQSAYFVETNKTVSSLGAQGTMFYVRFAESVGQNCQNGVLYVASDHKGIYTQLLAAKLTGRTLSRVDYSQVGANGTLCNLELVEILN